MAVNAPSDAPIFRLYTVEQIARRMAQSELYVMRMKSGEIPVRPGWKRKAVRAFGVSEDVLFGPTEVNDGS